MAILLGLLVSLTYGSGDFLGGLASKRAPTLTVVIGSFALSTVLVSIVVGGWMILGTPPSPAASDLWLGAATGVVGPVALGLLYQGLASGRMSVVAPITAVVAATVPFAWGLARGERPSAVALVGVAVALVAVVLISGAPAHEDHPIDAAFSPMRTVVPMAVASGLGFGIIYILLGETGPDAGLWPLAVARPLAVAITVTAAVGVARRRRTSVSSQVIPPRPALVFVAGAGVLDIGANAIYLAATNAGLLSIVAVLSSLYPATTVLLARVFLGERLHAIQVTGLLLAAVGIVAMAAG